VLPRDFYVASLEKSGSRDVMRHQDQPVDVGIGLQFCEDFDKVNYLSTSLPHFAGSMRPTDRPSETFLPLRNFRICIASEKSRPASVIAPFRENHEAEMSYENLSIAINSASAIIGLAALVYAIVRDKNKKDPKDLEKRDR
jgi:hypothetical protein